MSLSGPFFMDILTKLIDEGKESLCIQLLDSAPGADIFNFEHMVDIGFGHEHKQLRNISRIHFTGVNWCTSHTNQLDRL